MYGFVTFGPACRGHVMPLIGLVRRSDVLCGELRARGRILVLRALNGRVCRGAVEGRFYRDKAQFSAWFRGTIVVWNAKCADASLSGRGVVVVRLLAGSGAGSAVVVPGLQFQRRRAVGSVRTGSVLSRSLAVLRLRLTRLRGHRSPLFRLRVPAMVSG